MDFLRPPSRPDKRRIDVLIVDDDPGVRTLLGEVLSNMDLSFDVAVSGKDGYGKAMQNSYRLILMDLKMEEWDGMYAIQSLEACNEDCKVIVVSAYVDDDAQAELDQHKNVVAVLGKPFSTDELSKLIRKALS